MTCINLKILNYRRRYVPETTSRFLEDCNTALIEDTVHCGGIGRYEKHGELLKNPVECDSMLDRIVLVVTWRVEQAIAMVSTPKRICQNK